jgi:hypothetical protein
MKKKTWATPHLEVLEIGMTMNGPGKSNPDCFDVSDSKGDGPLSNASCLHPDPKPGNDLGS